MNNIIPFKKPFKLARREDVSDAIVQEWVIQAKLWDNDPSATKEQKDLAQEVLKQWGDIQ